MSRVETAPAGRARGLREDLARALARSVARPPVDADAAEARRLLELLLEGAEGPVLDGVPEDAAGYGSRVELEHEGSGEVAVHHLMSSRAMDLDAGHVSLDSPLGQALLGRRAGARLEVETPGGRLALRVRAVRTLPQWLEDFGATPSAARPPQKRGRTARGART